jgi:arginine deiminase
MNTVVLQGTEAACGTETGTATNFGGASVVRLINTGTAVHLVTLEEAGGTDKGTLSIAPKEVVFLKKSPTDKIFAADAGVKGVAVGFSH